MSSKRNPPIFSVRGVEASLVDDTHVDAEIETEAHAAMIFRFTPEQAIELSHALSRAFHQHVRPHRKSDPPSRK